ncbi:MAG: hypothetical protein MZW92_13760 [Comamonadaceae bacterium]|nr:hypothetical protein [Comamonadaceae bacterium]
MDTSRAWSPARRSATASAWRAHTTLSRGGCVSARPGQAAAARAPEPVVSAGMQPATWCSARSATAACWSSSTYDSRDRLDYVVRSGCGRTRPCIRRHRQPDVQVRRRHVPLRHEPQADGQSRPVPTSYAYDANGARGQRQRHRRSPG